VTFGVAELYDRVLFNSTDSLEGYISFKQQSIQGSISSYTTQIDEMEARLLIKKNMLLTRFARMESALQQLQSQSNWLGGQTEAASNGWYKAK
jgi:flagellar hook-associated protein 2